MTKLITKCKPLHLFYLGMAILAASHIPAWILGVNSIVPYHDQLDGEIIAYIYQAKYLFSENSVIPEFLNGAGKDALTPPAPLAVLLFRILQPFTAYMFLQIFGQFTAFAGMFLLCMQVIKNHYISFITALLFAFLPFLPVYGLSQFGAPMLLLCFYNLRKHKYTQLSYLYIALYTGMSSLVLVGFAWLAGGFLYAVFTVLTGRFPKHLRPLSGFLLMLILYVLENLSLLTQILGLGNTYTSHKAEYILNSAPFFSQLRNYVLFPSQHVNDLHTWIIPLIVIALLITLPTFKRQSDTIQTDIKLLGIDLCAIVLICILAALWETEMIVAIRRQLGGALGSFQFNRILWTTPALWYIALALSLRILLSCRKPIKYLSAAASATMLALLGFHCLKNSFVKPCIQKLLMPNYNAISWSDYMALNVIDQAEKFLLDTEGLSKEDYKVASLGIDPAAALYHGFYCVDGYSNNYSLDYKHQFRKVIAPELSKSDYLKAYYDDWGNRCYLFSAEFPAYYTIEKGMAWYNHLELDTLALKELGCDFILSSAYIVNAEDIHLSLLNENPFETEDSYYRIYIYKLDL